MSLSFTDDSVTMVNGGATTAIAGGRLIIDLTTTPIPEPSAAWLAGVALLSAHRRGRA